MLECDVAVIGAGAAGLAAARSAAERGCRVLLLEMRAGVGWQAHHLPCSAGEAKAFRLAVADRRGALKIISAGGSFEVEKKVAVLDCSALLRGMAVEAAKAGAEIWTSAPVQDLLPGSGRVRVAAGRWAEEIRAKAVVDASGASGGWSAVLLRRATGRGWPNESLAFRCEYLMANAGCESAEICFSSYSAPAGFGWILPAGEGLASVGILGLRIHPATALDEFLGRTDHPGLARASPIASVKTGQPVAEPLTRSLAEGVIAAGRAAAHVPPVAVNTLRYEIGSGELAGEAAARAALSGDPEALREYWSRWGKTLGLEVAEYRRLWRGLGAMQDGRVSRFLSGLEREGLLGDLARVLLAERPLPALRRILTGGAALAGG